jgi:4-hydroxy-tetrahydrodipicolinate reductase
MTTQVAVVGATGRLGAQVCRVVESMEDWAVIARLDSQSDLQEVLGADVVVDVTQPGVSATVVDFAIEQGLPILVGTSGWSAERLKGLEKKVTDHPGASVFVVPNFSLGATVQNLLAATAAEFFDSVEIVETHHAGKVDSPSGTAVRAAETMARVRRDRGGVLAPHSEQSARGEQVQGIPVHSLRLHGVVASQDIVFGGVGETLTVSHHTSSQDAYAQGIAVSLRYLLTHPGLTVGLERALGVSVP